MREKLVTQVALQGQTEPFNILNGHGLIQTQALANGRGFAAVMLALVAYSAIGSDERLCQYKTQERNEEQDHKSLRKPAYQIRPIAPPFSQDNDISVTTLIWSNRLCFLGCGHYACLHPKKRILFVIHRGGNPPLWNDLREQITLASHIKLFGKVKLLNVPVPNAVAPITVGAHLGQYQTIRSAGYVGVCVQGNKQYLVVLIFLDCVISSLAGCRISRCNAGSNQLVHWPV